MNAWVYIRRCADGSYYIGSARGSLDHRIGQHHAGEMAGYTSKRRPVKLVWSMDFQFITEAIALEQQLKGGSRAKKEALIRGDYSLLPLLASRSRAAKAVLASSFETRPLGAPQHEELGAHHAGAPQDEEKVEARCASARPDGEKADTPNPPHPEERAKRASRRGGGSGPEGSPPIALVVAVAENGVIGVNGQLPWRLPGDLKRFKTLTMGKPVIMGRKTWDSLPKKPLPGRINIVMTRDYEFRAGGAMAAHSIEAALAEAEKSQPAEISVIGGEAILAAALPLASVMYLTEVAVQPEGDAFMPPFDRKEWKETAREGPFYDGPLRYDYVTLERR